MLPPWASREICPEFSVAGDDRKADCIALMATAEQLLLLGS